MGGAPTRMNEKPLRNLVEEDYYLKVIVRQTPLSTLYRGPDRARLALRYTLALHHLPCSLVSTDTDGCAADVSF